MKRIMGTWNRQKSELPDGVAIECALTTFVQLLGLRLTRRDPVYPDGSPEAILLKEVVCAWTHVALCVQFGPL
jgi:hypothetical protein